MNNRKIKTILPLTVLASALVLAGCSDSGSTGGATATGSASAKGGTSGAIQASGSTAQKNAMAEWVNAFQTANPGVTVDYQANGSGAGIQDFINKQTSFAGSDAALKPDEAAKADARCTGGKAVNIPMVGGAIAIAYNLPGVDNLTLTPDVLAGIFNNTITKWNDPKIAKLNPTADLPAATIAQFHRSDESGTTANFGSYLTAAAPKVWTEAPGKAWTAPGGQGSKGSDGVAAALSSTPNSIGYVELSFVLDNTALKSALIDNGGGAVAATSKAAARTIAAAKVVGTGGDLALQLDPKIADGKSYPIALVTYEITCTKGLPADQLKVTKAFLKYAASDAGQGMLTDLGYVPISGSLLTKVQAATAALS